MFSYELKSIKDAIYGICHLRKAALFPLIIFAMHHFAHGGCPYAEMLRLNESRNLRSRRLENNDTDTVLTKPPSVEVDDINTKLSMLPTTYISQNDFTNGTLRITLPGRYVLTEDISFAPNSAKDDTNWRDKAVECCKPRPDQFSSNGGNYPDVPYSLGFFAAITVETNAVVIDLNGYTIEQSVEHALMQRFFSVIELNSTPFIPGQGPRNFGDVIANGVNVHIEGGTIGRSAHHGIHGNGNNNVKISNVKFVDFEVAAIALNGVHNLVVQNCDAWNRKDVPVLGLFAAGVFMHRYTKAVKEKGVSTTLRVQGEIKTASDILEELEESIINVYEDIVIKERKWISKKNHPKDYAIYHNDKGLVDGNAYGFLTNCLGVAIFGFPYDEGRSGKKHARNVKYENVTLHDLQADIREVVTLKRADIGKHVTDALGGVLQLRTTEFDYPFKPIVITDNDDRKAEYIGNAVANAQIFVAKCILKGEVPTDDLHLPTGGNKINDDIVNWVEVGGDSINPERFLSNLTSKLVPDENDNGYVCNGDSMYHVNKGIVGFKIDNSDLVRVNRAVVKKMVNHGRPGSNLCGEYDVSHKGATQVGYGGASVRGFSFSGSKRALIKDSSVSNLVSINGAVVGYDIMTNSSHIILQDCNETELVALGKWGQNPITAMDALGARFNNATTKCQLRNPCFKQTFATSGSREHVYDSGRENKVARSVC
eukprot:CAMPEP_0172505450 /NCGR_PEP_ID=MMETSP1066-20121228/186623_1 /TAXON_ID=671091 /ORGANISM="Coscinodiscus wailesii, Strain CCMP2513" /LENGTH=709 /DNA_ID=CAMNT_0013282057 /DNA_START=35 /DNA_END=2164 /DNA_ORIENTATION=+